MVPASGSRDQSAHFLYAAQFNLHRSGPNPLLSSCRLKSFHNLLQAFLFFGGGELNGGRVERVRNAGYTQNLLHFQFMITLILRLPIKNTTDRYNYSTFDQTFNHWMHNEWIQAVKDAGLHVWRAHSPLACLARTHSHTNTSESLCLAESRMVKDGREEFWPVGTRPPV